MLKYSPAYGVSVTGVVSSGITGVTSGGGRPEACVAELATGAGGTLGVGTGGIAIGEDCFVFVRED
jgi:hypothetical protein